MTDKEAQKVLDELQGVRPEALNGEAKRLFEAIMKIVEQRDLAWKEQFAMASYIAELDIDEDICRKMGKTDCDKTDFGVCENCIIEYFEKEGK